VADVSSSLRPTPPNKIKKYVTKKEDFEPNKMYQYGILLK
jgi:hypothetical protein